MIIKLPPNEELFKVVLLYIMALSASFNLLFKLIQNLCYKELDQCHNHFTKLPLTVAAKDILWVTLMNKH